MARVAAALELLSPNMIPLSAGVYPKIFCVTQAEIHLLAQGQDYHRYGDMTASRPLKMPLKSTSMPTPMRKTGMKMEFPTNSVLFMRGRCGG